MPELSTPVQGGKVTDIPVLPLGASAVMSSPHETTGASMSAARDKDR